ncbi:HD-GYP domain-containing protein [Paenibacillus hemerocallicola]|uniref:HD-GYP domain-containing protein n=2 Tax=Paenibacillus hemerocallicola TaxID=1172614 RepID=A0A5C4SX09_9BACL|nr:HD-GYP domain-containing protein [Paenibacillus hemerocallicola]
MRAAGKIEASMAGELRMNATNLVGSKLIKDLVTENGVVLIPCNTILTREHVEFIDRHHIPLDLLELERLPRDMTNESLIFKATEEIREIFHYMRRRGTVPIEEVQSSIIPTIHQAAEYPTLYSVLSGLQAKDDYTYRHNIGVGVISTLIGKWLKLSEADLGLLTTAATLHDVGKIRIDDDILNKPGKYTDEEYSLMKRHAEFGYEIICNTPGIDHQVALVALQHHEREDGKGYPYGITENRITYFSKIVAVADVFHAMTSKRVYKEASPFYQVMQQMLSDSFGRLHPVICNVFVQRMMEMSVGSEVTLTDGRKGRILMVHPGDPVNPSILAADEYIDLRKNHHLHIDRLTR